MAKSSFQATNRGPKLRIPRHIYRRNSRPLERGCTLETYRDSTDDMVYHAMHCAWPAEIGPHSVTLALAWVSLNAVTFAFWWFKPIGVQEPIKIYWKTEIVKTNSFSQAVSAWAAERHDQARHQICGVPYCKRFPVAFSASGTGPHHPATYRVKVSLSLSSWKHNSVVRVQAHFHLSLIDTHRADLA